MQDQLLSQAEVPGFILSYLVGKNLPEDFDVYTLDDMDRSLLRKLVIYDSANPTEKNVPTDEQVETFFAVPKANGQPANFAKCRFFAQELLPTVTDSATTVQTWVDYTDYPAYGLMLNVKFKVRILCHYATETYRSPTGIYSRSMAIAHLVESLLDWQELPEFGVGKLHFIEMKRVSDNRERVGYEMTFEVTV